MTLFITTTLKKLRAFPAGWEEAQNQCKRIVNGEWSEGSEEGAVMVWFQEIQRGRAGAAPTGTLRADTVAAAVCRR